MRLLRAAAVAAVSLSAVLAAGCGTNAQMERFAGEWQRLEGGSANPDFTLRIEGDGETAVLTFENQSNGTSARTQAVLARDVLSCTLPTGAGEGPAAAPASPSPSVDTQDPAATADEALPTEVPVQLSLDESGEVVSVQMVAPGEQLVPLWQYGRPGT